MKKVLIASSAALIASATPVIAHHGTSAHFDHDKEITVEGVVSEMKFVNPHSYLFFDALTDSGEVMPWRCEMVEAGTLRRAGMTQDILTPGTVVRVTGYPGRREAGLCYLETVMLSDGRTVSHRGQISEGGAGFTPNEALKSITASSAPDGSVILANGGTEAANREIVPVPTQGFFGYWSEGTRNAAAANTGNNAGGMGAGGMGGGMGAGGDTGGMGGMGAGGDTGGMGGMGGGGNANGMGAGGMGGGDATATAGAAAGAGDTVGRRTTRPDVQYNPEGLAIAQRYDPSFDNPALACKASVLFGLGHHSLSNEFVQISEKELRLTYGYMDMVRTIHVDGTFPDDFTPSIRGYSIGEWEDEHTLTVTTRGFAPGVLFAYAGAAGAPLDVLSTINSDQLEVIERFQHDPASDRLLYNWSATDSGYWTVPASGDRTLSRANPYEVYGCVELAGENSKRASGETLFNILPVEAGSQPPTANVSASAPSASISVPNVSASAPNASVSAPEGKSAGKSALKFILIAGLLLIGAGIIGKKILSKPT